MPTDRSRPAPVMTGSIEFDTLGRMMSGFQPRLSTARIDCAANFGVVRLRKTVAPVFFSRAIGESTVGSESS